MSFEYLSFLLRLRNFLKHVKKYGYEECHLLNPDDLEIRDGNCNIEVTELGFSIPSIDNEINSLNNRSEEIYFTLHSK